MDKKDDGSQHLHASSEASGRGGYVRISDDPEAGGEKRSCIFPEAPGTSSLPSGKEGTMYPVLHALEEQGAVESYEKAAESGRMRKYYHLTKKGERLLGKKKEEWEKYEKAVHAVLEGGAVCVF